MVPSCGSVQDRVWNEPARSYLQAGAVTHGNAEAQPAWAWQAQAAHPCRQRLEMPRKFNARYSTAPPGDGVRAKDCLRTIAWASRY